MQHRLAGDAQALGGLLHGKVAVWGVLPEAAPQCVIDANAPCRAGGEPFAGNEAIVEPAGNGRRRDAEFARGLPDVHELAGRRLCGRYAARDTPMAPKITTTVLREARA